MAPGPHASLGGGGWRKRRRLRDEGRAYAERLRQDGVKVDELCYAGQPHGFLNLDFPAAALAHEYIGTWLRQTFAQARAETI